MYTQDYDERFPPASHLRDNQTVTVPSLLHAYAKNGDYWQCPAPESTQDRRYTYDGSPGDSTVSYGFNGAALNAQGLGVLRDQVGTPGETVAFVDSLSFLAAPVPLAESIGAAHPVARHEGLATVCWTDGHVSAVSMARLDDVTPEGSRPGLPGINAYRYWNLR
jgi:prepilin-type processing-associated H-X9-DG protein